MSCEALADLVVDRNLLPLATLFGAQSRVAAHCDGAQLPLKLAVALEALGRETSLRRIGQAIEKLKKL